MEEFKNLTTEQLKQTITEINKELCNRKNEERKEAYKDLINALKKFQKTDFCNIDDCYIEIYCNYCEDKTSVNIFGYFVSMIEELERKILR